MPKRDSQLVTIEELTDRINSCRHQAYRLCEREDRDNHVVTFNKRQTAIAKLNARVDVLHSKRAVLLRKEREAAVENNLDAFLAD